MVVEQNRRIAGVKFYHGIDVTADMLNALEQYLSTELTDRTKDFTKYAGFAWGLEIGNVSGQSITITSGVGIDQLGRRLYHPASASYKITFPASGSGQNEGFLCVRAFAKDVSYKVHPYDGVRKPVETAVGLEFFVDVSSFTDSVGNRYPSDNNGLVLTKLSISGATYNYDSLIENNNRSPYLTLRDGA